MGLKRLTKVYWSLDQKHTWQRFVRKALLLLHITFFIGFAISRSADCFSIYLASPSGMG